MRIVVVNGSPSGVNGTTACSVRYLEKRCPHVEFKTLEVARSIRALERDLRRLTEVVETMASADLILWAFPVYVMLVPAQLKRFIELLFERNLAGKLRGGTACCLSTSAHHYDHTAHDFMREVCADLGLSWRASLSAGFEDLPEAGGQQQLDAFARELLFHATHQTETVALPPRPVVDRPARTWPFPTPPASLRRHPSTVVIISDASPGDHVLSGMIDRYRQLVDADVKLLSLATLRVDGGCVGCMNCSDGAACVYRDEFAASFENLVMKASVIIYAGTIRQRGFSARMKAFIDRYFTYGHRPLLAGKLMGFLVSGPLSQLRTFEEVLEAHIEVSHCQRLGVASDDCDDLAQVAQVVDSMARATDRWLAHPWRAPPTFRGHAADKNFRDLVYSHRGMMTADHRFYRANGLYDFPQRDWGRQLLNLFLLWARKLPALAARLKKDSRRARLARHERTLARVEPLS